LRFFTPLATFLPQSAAFRSAADAKARLELSTVYVCCTHYADLLLGAMLPSGLAADVLDDGFGGYFLAHFFVPLCDPMGGKSPLF
jgi:hypothetical protein